MPGASLMMRFFGSPPRESRSASGPGTEADYQQGGGEDPGALRAARTSGKAGRPPTCTRRRRPTSRQSAEAPDRNLTTRATQPTETGLAGWGHETRTTKSIRTEIRLSCRENLPDLAESMFRNRSSVSCAFASLQLRQALGKSCPAEGPN
jgi:hypothetical protein